MRPSIDGRVQCHLLDRFVLVDVREQVSRNPITHDYSARHPETGCDVRRIKQTHWRCAIMVENLRRVPTAYAGRRLVSHTWVSVDEAFDDTENVVRALLELARSAAKSRSVRWQSGSARSHFDDLLRGITDRTIERCFLSTTRKCYPPKTAQPIALSRRLTTEHPSQRGIPSFARVREPRGWSCVRQLWCRHPFPRATRNWQ